MSEQHERSHQTLSQFNYKASQQIKIGLNKQGVGRYGLAKQDRQVTNGKLAFFELLTVNL